MADHVLTVGSDPSMSDTCRPNDMPYLGITYLPVTGSLAQYHSIESGGGLLITAVARNSPAWRVGLQPNDVILSFDGQIITPDTSLVSILMEHQIGDTVVLAVARQNGTREVKLTLSKRPGS